MAEGQDERCVAEYTEQDRANEGCCWTWQRDQCPGAGCRCVCHMSGEPVRTTYFDLVKEIEGYRQRSRDEDTARIRLNHARIEAEERAAKAEAERDAALARLAAAESANARAADSIMQDVLDLDPDDPEHPDTICISYDALVVVLENALRGADAALAGSRAQQGEG